MSKNPILKRESGFKLTMCNAYYTCTLFYYIIISKLLEGLVQTMSREDIVTDIFDGKLWLLLVDKATMGTDGKLTFTLRNGMEVEM